VHEITSAYGEEFLFRFKARSVAHSQLRNTLCNAEAGQKDESDGDVISCTFLSSSPIKKLSILNLTYYYSNNIIHHLSLKEKVMLKTTPIIGLACLGLIACSETPETSIEKTPTAPPVAEVAAEPTAPKEVAPVEEKTAETTKEKSMTEQGMDMMSGMGDVMKQAADSAKDTYDNTDIKGMGSDIADKSKELYQEAKNSEAADTAGEVTDTVIDKSKEAIEYIKDKASDLNQETGGDEMHKKTTEI